MERENRAIIQKRCCLNDFSNLWWNWETIRISFLFPCSFVITQNFHISWRRTKNLKISGENWGERWESLIGRPRRRRRRNDGPKALTGSSFSSSSRPQPTSPVSAKRKEIYIYSQLCIWRLKSFNSGWLRSLDSLIPSPGELLTIFLYI